MRMDKLTSKFQMALADDQSLAVGPDHQLIEPVHLLMVLKKESDGSSRKRLSDLEEQIADLEREFFNLEEVWKADKAALQGTTHIKVVAEAIRRSRAGLADPNRLNGSFLFLGPNWRGKDRTVQDASRVLVR